jgi:hypothetical protein
MRSYDYYESELQEKLSEQIPENDKLEICVKDFHSESYRFDEEINTCDDGRSG